LVSSDWFLTPEQSDSGTIIIQDKSGQAKRENGQGKGKDYRVEAFVHRWHWLLLCDDQECSQCSPKAQSYEGTQLLFINILAFALNSPVSFLFAV
jgi:hypothetical protein